MRKKMHALLSIRYFIGPVQITCTYIATARFRKDFQSEYLKEGDHLGDPDEDGSITLKWILVKQVARV